jgi:uncharacterized protein (TIGR02588 family)
MNKNTEKQGKGRKKKNWLEWSVFGVSLLLVLAVLGYLSYMVITHVPSPPDLYVEGKHEPSNKAPNRYQIKLFNKGGETAEHVLIELTLERDATAVEKAKLEIQFAPQNSERVGWVEFTENITPTDIIKARVVSYNKP